jgi:Thioredoxin
MVKWTTLTNLSFEEFTRLHEFAVVHFWASWNRYDVQTKELIESQTTDDLSEQIAFASFDTDSLDHHEICRHHKVINLPFLAFYRHGALVHTRIGMLSAEALLQHMRQLIDPTEPMIGSN